MKKWFRERISKLAEPKYEEVLILREVIDDIVKIAKGSYPREFITLLSGEIKDRKLVVKGLVYQVFHPSKNSALMRMNLPMISGVVGSVHSHPTPNSIPSRADLVLFNKHGHIHLIIGYPFKKENIAAYDSYGKKISFRVI